MDPKDRDAIEERRKYVRAFNDTMVTIWRERILALGVMRTGSLYSSVVGLKALPDADALSAEFSLKFLTYGIFQNFGTGKEVPRGNPGDIGRPKVRKARRWFDKKYYSSVMNIRDFWADSLSLEYIGIVTDALSDRKLRQQAIDAP